MPNRSLVQILDEARLAIDNALANADILAALSAFGYDEARLNEGKALYEEARALYEVQRDRYGEQFAATQALEAKWEEARRVYGTTLKLARQLFKDDTEATASLHLKGARARSLAAWVAQASTFYNNLLRHAAWVEKMGNFGYDQARLEAERDLVQEVIALNEAQEAAKGLAQKSTKERDAKIAELEEWMALFRTAAQAALADDPQLLENLGFGAVP